MVRQGTWVSVAKTILAPDERAKGIPEDTAKTPLKMWVSGHLLRDAEIGARAEILTRMNRREEGVLEEASPTTRIGYGDFVPEIMQIGAAARAALSGGERNG